MNVIEIYVGFYLTFSIYHFFVFIGRKKDQSNLAYSLFNIAICSLMISFQILPKYNIEQNILYIFSTISTILSAGTIAYFSHTIYNLKKIKLFTYIGQSILTLIGIINIFSWIFFKYLLMFFYLLAGLWAIIYLITMVIFIIINKEYNTVKKNIILIGFGFMFISFLIGGIVTSMNIEIPSVFLYTGFIIMGIIFGYALIDNFNQEHRDLIDLKNELEQKVDERTAELRQSKKEIEQLSQQKTDFFVNISHELRTPLTLIQIYFNKYIKKMNLKLDKDIQIVSNSLNKLKRDILNFFDIERFNAGKQIYDNSKISDFSQILTETMKLFKEYALTKKVFTNTNINKDIYLKIDPQALDRIIYNIVDNAIKYTEKQGLIEVNLNADENNIKFTISNTGKHITEEQQQHIFEPYYQSSHKKQNYQGIGMGLSIVKQIVDSVNGNIKIESKVGEGTTFIITFNRYYIKPEDTTEKVILNNDISYNNIEESIRIVNNDNKYNLLIVEDNLEQLAMLIEAFSFGYNVYPAINGIEALEMLKEMPQKPELIISDIMMDEMDGIELFNEIDKNPNYKDIPFIFLTAKGTEQQKIAGLLQGAVDYITKPFNSIEVIIAKADALIKNRKATINKTASNIITSAMTTKKSVMTDKEKEKQQELIFYKRCEKVGLTEKEKELGRLLLEGLANKEIEYKLGLAQSTVSDRINILYNKFGCEHNKAALIKTMLQND